MRRRFAAVAVALALAMAPLGASGQSPGSVATENGADYSANAGKDHVAFTGSAPTPSSCGGGSPSLDATASDGGGTITEGSSASGCTLTFAHAYNTAPHCTVSSPTGSALTSYTATASALTIVNGSASGDKFTYVCVQ